MHTELDDARLLQLLRGCSARHTADLEELYKCMAPRLLGQLVTMLEDRAQAEEALQEVFIKIWERAKQYDPARGPPVTWLVSLARHHAIDLLRSRRVTLPIDDLQMQLAEEPGWPSQESGETGAQLGDCLNRLSIEQRRCIKLAYVGGHSQEQIAAALDSPLGSVKSSIRRALLSLRECMGP